MTSVPDRLSSCSWAQCVGTVNTRGSIGFTGGHIYRAT